MISDMLIESDVPKVLPDEAGRFVSAPGFPPIVLRNARRVGDVLQFDVLNRGPIPFIVGVGIRFTTPSGEVWTSARDSILVFARDEWQSSIPSGATGADIRVSIWPLEVALARLEVPF